MPKFGVIDLGTNTFHLLIAEVNEQEVTEIYRERIFVKLAEDGIHQIGNGAWNRAVHAIGKFKTILDHQQVEKVSAFGTAGLRSANNSSEFIEKIKIDYDLDISVISGDEEARLIHKGVMAALGTLDTRSLIMDIGGGSVEFIICDNENIYWAQSFKIGVAVLFNNFQQQDPISKSEIEKIFQHLKTTLLPLQDALQKNHTTTLIGASGTFDVLENMLVKEKTNPNFANFPAHQFQNIYDRIIFSNLQDRHDNPEIPNDRAELITVAIVLLKYVIQLAHTNEIIVSSYAMKEGILQEMLIRSQ